MWERKGAPTGALNPKGEAIPLPPLAGFRDLGSKRRAAVKPASGAGKPPALIGAPECQLDVAHRNLEDVNDQRVGFVHEHLGAHPSCLPAKLPNNL